MLRNSNHASQKLRLLLSQSSELALPHLSLTGQLPWHSQPCSAWNVVLPWLAWLSWFFFDLSNNFFVPSFGSSSSPFYLSEKIPQGLVAGLFILFLACLSDASSSLSSHCHSCSIVLYNLPDKPSPRLPFQYSTDIIFSINAFFPGNLICRHKLNYHLHAKDSQTSLNSSLSSICTNTLVCLSYASLWISNHCHSFSIARTEFFTISLTSPPLYLLSHTAPISCQSLKPVI